MKPYTIEKISDRKFSYRVKAFEGTPFTYREAIEQEFIETIKEPCFILFDLKNINGHTDKRFYECHFNGERLGPNNPIDLGHISQKLYE